jgi:hypothetical protein
MIAFDNEVTMIPATDSGNRVQKIGNDNEAPLPFQVADSKLQAAAVQQVNQQVVNSSKLQ